MSIRTVALTVIVGTQHQIDIAQGEDRRWLISYTDAAGAPIDFTGSVNQTMTVRDNQGQLIVARVGAVFGPGADGKVEYIFSQSDTSADAAQTYAVDTEWVDGAGYRTQLLAASAFTVLPSVSSASDIPTTPPAVPVVYGLRWLGAWNGITVFQINDAISYPDKNGSTDPLSSFRCIAPNTNTPPVNGSGTLSIKWAYIAQHGAAGAAGPNGAPGFFYPTDYGAIGNGIADDTAAWNAMLAAMKTAGGGSAILNDKVTGKPLNFKLSGAVAVDFAGILGIYCSFLGGRITFGLAAGLGPNLKLANTFTNPPPALFAFQQAGSVEWVGTTFTTTAIGTQPDQSVVIDGMIGVYRQCSTINVVKGPRVANSDSALFDQCCCYVASSLDSDALHGFEVDTVTMWELRGCSFTSSLGGAQSGHPIWTSGASITGRISHCMSDSNFAYSSLAGIGAGVNSIVLEGSPYVLPFNCAASNVRIMAGVGDFSLVRAGVGGWGNAGVFGPVLALDTNGKYVEANGFTPASAIVAVAYDTVAANDKGTVLRTPGTTGAIAYDGVAALAVGEKLTVSALGQGLTARQAAAGGHYCATSRSVVDAMSGPRTILVIFGGGVLE